MNRESADFLSLTDIVKSYHWKGKALHALNGINIVIQRGKTLGIVGESGSGKTTLGRIAACLEPPSQGRMSLYGSPIEKLSKEDKISLRRSMQVIFQDPYSSLNPLMTIEQCIGEGIDIHKIAFGEERRELIKKLLDDVGLPPEAMERYPHEFSGGQRQRIVIARALAVKPEFLVCDEPLASLDTCTQRQVMDLFKKLKKEHQLTMLFISHDISAVQAISDTIAVMYLGTIVEIGTAEELVSSPKHPYTKALIGSVPIADPAAERARKKMILIGDPPSPLSPPSGCPFHPRCTEATDKCRSERPALLVEGAGNTVACHHS